MNSTDLIFFGIAQFITLLAALASFIYGLEKFFKKGTPLCLQSITIAMGCHTLSSLFQICYIITNKSISQNFTSAYLGNIGFFLFFITASYGQMDKIIDDGTDAFRPSRVKALAAPVIAASLLIPNLFFSELTLSMKITYVIIWVFAAISLYYSFKHAIVPDLDFGFIKAIKSYNVFAVCVGFSELLCLTAQNYGVVYLLAASLLFAVFSVSMMISAKSGVKKWTI